MTTSTTVSNFEKRIKNIQKKKKRNLIFKVVTCVLTFSLIAVYFCLPISKVENCKIEGNIHYSHDEILSIAGIEKKQSLYLISKDKIVQNLESSPLIGDKSVDVELSPAGLKINIEELVPVLQFEKDQFFSDGTLLDQDLLKSKDPLIGDYLYLHTQNLIPVYSKPYENKFVESRVRHLSKLILNLDETSKSKIKGVSYDSNSYYYCFYYDTGLEDETLLKVVFDSAKKIEDLKIIIESSNVDRYISYLNDEKTKDNFISFQEIINGEEKSVKSVKIIMQSTNDGIHYHVKYNNPVNSGIIE